MKKKELEEYVDVLEKLLQERERLLAEIPPCPVHGADCVPHAIDWVKSHLTKRAADGGNAAQVEVKVQSG